MINMFLKSMDMEAMLADFANGQEEQADAVQQTMAVEKDDMQQDTNDIENAVRQTDEEGKVE